MGDQFIFIHLRDYIVKGLFVIGWNSGFVLGDKAFESIPGYFGNFFRVQEILTRIFIFFHGMLFFGQVIECFFRTCESKIFLTY